MLHLHSPRSSLEEWQWENGGTKLRVRTHKAEVGGALSWMGGKELLNPAVRLFMHSAGWCHVTAFFPATRLHGRLRAWCSLDWSSLLHSARPPVSALGTGLAPALHMWSVSSCSHAPQCYAHVPAPQDECKLHVLQRCTNNIEIKIKNSVFILGSSGLTNN